MPVNTDTPSPSQASAGPVAPEVVAELRRLYQAEVDALRAMQASVGDKGADPKLLDKWIAAAGQWRAAAHAACQNALGRRKKAEARDHETMAMEAAQISRMIRGTLPAAPAPDNGS